jgi:hypothetical protein
MFAIIQLQNPLSPNLVFKNIKIKVHRIAILSVVLCGCATWSFRVGEDHRLTVFENGGLRRIFGPQWDEVKGKWKRLHNEGLYDLCSSPNIIWVIRSRKMR